ncbi:unnamed protein product, partial [Didymodactylos carnosus]
MSMLTLETLPFELYFHIFQYLLPHEILQTFLNINSRFNSAINLCCCKRISLVGVSTVHFQYYYHHVIPKLKKENIIALHLSYRNVTSQVILQKFFDLEQHQHLTYLRLCINVNHSTDSCCYNLLCQEVFSIPTLKICYLLKYNDIPKLVLTSQAVKLEYLEIHLGYKNGLLMLLNHIPSIKHLSVSIIADDKDINTTTTDDSTAIVQLPCGLK